MITILHVNISIKEFKSIYSIYCSLLMFLKLRETYPFQWFFYIPQIHLTGLLQQDFHNLQKSCLGTLGFWYFLLLNMEGRTWWCSKIANSVLSPLRRHNFPQYYHPSSDTISQVTLPLQWPSLISCIKSFNEKFIIPYLARSASVNLNILYHLSELFSPSKMLTQ